MSQSERIPLRSWVILFLSILVIGGCIHFYHSSPDCIRIKGTTAVYCRCEFKTRDEWIEFSHNLKKGSDWEGVIYDTDPCNKTTSDTPPTSNDNTSDNSSTYTTKSQQELQNNLNENNTIKDTIQRDNNSNKPEKHKLKDSIGLFDDTQQGYILTQKLPITFYSDYQKFEFRKIDTTLIVEISRIDGGGNRLYQCVVNRNDIKLVDANWVFNYNMGMVWVSDQVNDPNSHQAIQLRQTR